MTTVDTFIEKLLRAAAEAGISPAEVCYAEDDSFSARAMEGAIDQYEVSATRALGIRGSVDGRMGYASTEAFDDAAVRMLVEAVKESAALAEAEEQDEIFAGEDTYPTLETPESDIDSVSAEDKLDLLRRIEKAALSTDPRVTKSQGAYISTGHGRVRIVNTLGLDLSREAPLGGFVSCGAYVVGRDGDSVVTGNKSFASHLVREVDPESVGAAAADDAASMLHASPVASGVYRAVIRRDAMRSLLATFRGIFSAENAQQKLSLLGGREGEKIAADCVTLMDDPLLPGGFASAVFDAEGSATRTKAVIDGGVLTTLLHNRKTAAKQGVATTGNASGGMGGAIHVSATNLFFKPGEKDLPELLSEMDDGLLITYFGGLHAGANPISGDFSLLSSGYLIANGHIVRPVEQITVAGNFYQLLKNIRAVGSDLEFLGGGIGSPSVDVGAVNVSGAEG